MGIFCHTVFWLTENNRLYGNGKNTKYQLGIGDNTNHYMPQLIPMHFVKQIKPADDYTLCLCDYTSIVEWFCQPYIAMHKILTIIKTFFGRKNNQVFATCYSEFGGNGLGKEQKKDGMWHEIETFKDLNIVKIETGVKHSLFLEDNGTLWSVGINDKG